MAEDVNESDRQAPHQSRVERRRQFYRSFEAQALNQRSFFTRISDDLNNAFGSTTFLIINVLWFTIWILVNLGLVPGVIPFDPFPFGLMTMALSIEAIVLSIFILVSQNRTSYVDTLREELHLQVNLIAEEEITKVLNVLAEMRQKMGITQPDPELEEMLKRTNTGYIERSLVEQIQKANIPLASRFAGRLKNDFPDLLDPLKILPPKEDKK